MSVFACGDDGAMVVPDAAPPCFQHPGTKRLRAEARRFGTLGNGAFTGMICVDGRDDLPCTTPESTNNFSLCVPDTGDYLLRSKSTDYQPALWPFGPGMVAINAEVSVGNTSYVGASFFDPVGAAYPPTTNGNLIVTLTYRTTPDSPVAGPLAGASFTVSPSTGATTYYFNEMPKADMTLTATTNASAGVIPNLAPGMYDIKVTSASAPNCRSSFGGGWAPTTAGNHMRVPIVAGTDTLAYLDCSP